MTQTRPTRLAIAAMAGALALTAAAAVWRAPQCNWDLGFFAVLLAFSIFSDLTAVSTESKVKVSGSFLALVVAMVFLGGTPAALIGVATILVGWLRWRDDWHYLLDNVLTYALFPLVGGIAFHEGIGAIGLTASDPSFYLCVFGLFQFALALNFLMIASYGCYVERSSFKTKLKVLPPVLPSEFASAMLAVASPSSTPRSGSPRSPSSASSSSPSSTCSGSCCSPSSGPASWSCAASSWPASRSGC